VKYAPAPVFAMFATALLVNFGELIFFATGDLGLQMWLILALCHEYAVRVRHLSVVSNAGECLARLNMVPAYCKR
jgi:hypothetical protein